MTAGYREGTTGYAAAAATISLTAPSARVSGDILVAALLSPTDVDKAAPTGWTKYAGPTQTDGSQVWRLNSYVRTADGTATDNPDWGANGTASGYGVLSVLGCWQGYTAYTTHDDDASAASRTATIGSHAGTIPTDRAMRYVYPVAWAANAATHVDSKPTGASIHENTSYTGVSVRRLILASDQNAIASTEPAATFTADSAQAALIQRIVVLEAPLPPTPPAEPMPRRETTVKELPHAITTASVARVKDPDTKRALEEVLRAVQANMDHHQGTLRESARQFGLLAEDVRTLGNKVNGVTAEEGV